MADRLTRASRSLVMRRNRGRGNRSTELRLRAFLVRSRVRGWRLGDRSEVPGRPDFIFTGPRVAVFVDGCFWHGCPRCRSIPVSNRSFWRAKIARNKSRDRRVGRLLRSKGWKVVRIWEHQLTTDGPSVVLRILRAL